MNNEPNSRLRVTVEVNLSVRPSTASCKREDQGITALTLTLNRQKTHTTNFY